MEICWLQADGLHGGAMRNLCGAVDGNLRILCIAGVANLSGVGNSKYHEFSWCQNFLSDK